jgi:hypothetical protein
MNSKLTGNSRRDAALAIGPLPKGFSAESAACKRHKRSRSKLSCGEQEKWIERPPSS